MANYFNSLSLREQVRQLKQCRFMSRDEFSLGCTFLKNKRIVIVGCGAQGLNQGLNMRDSGLDVRYALRQSAIDENRDSFKRACDNGFQVGTYNQLVPEADVVYNLTPDKQHADVVNAVMPLMKEGAALAYSHGFNIVEQGQQIRADITVVMCAPKCPGTEVREEYKRGFGVPTLIAVHPENDPQQQGWEIAKALASATGGDRAGVLASSFVAEVKSDLMGEQTILCGMQQSAAILAFDKMTADGIDAAYAAALIQQGLEQITEALKLGGITHMMDRLSNPDKLTVMHLADELKQVLRPLFEQHQDDILSGKFSEQMMQDWADEDSNLLRWRQETLSTGFEQAPAYNGSIDKQEFFDNGLFLVAMIKAGVELAFEVMVEAGMLPESAYYESLHETPLIANTIARKRLYEMNVVISDTAEYGNYLFCQRAIPLLREAIMPKIDLTLIGKARKLSSNYVNNQKLLHANFAIRDHLIESVGHSLREHMLTMRSVA
ncbi:ketol-acid reductoisomerase [Alteromonas ponticola]|uniref:Ketol-acid reductoisomerase n=1 Tax=Alteromonas aquimaris TaxID=2998417 RepID=A0ABT3P857_9ALTE|nr:ketol-acid reductoisomerase [Alteromonas aquimaris]MCW8108958.1 ketol-acid reductoisomerase [Alteromonas aquimaris]